MYKLHLILKYLRKRRIAWVSLIAVTLCTAMVLVVISVMGGWLRMFRQSFHGLTGDVIVEGRSRAGFPYYQAMIDRINKLPEVAAAVPTIETGGLIKINNIRDMVQVIGYPDDIGTVNDFPSSLHRQGAEASKTGKVSFGLLPNIPYDKVLPNAKNVAHRPGMIVGAEVVGIGKDSQGNIQRPDDDLLYTAPVRLTVMGISVDAATIDPSDATTLAFWVVDDSRTKIWQYDSKTVYVPFAVLQKSLGMEEYNGEPARANSIQVKVKPGYDINVVSKKIDALVQDVIAVNGIIPDYPIQVQTWEESQRLWLHAIENEKSLVTILFSIISVVAIFLIFCIFYMIVAEKTRDIGIIKSVGATSAGVAGIFLGYGLVIGLLGAGLGFAAGYGIVHNINWLHSEFARITGSPIWDPQVYAFDTIPNTMNPHEVAVILGIAVISSVAGALVPAMRAARMNPVEALRWE